MSEQDREKKENERKEIKFTVRCDYCGQEHEVTTIIFRENLYVEVGPSGTIMYLYR